MLILAKELVENIESGDAGVAQLKLEALSQLRDADLFQELGKLTRQLHESLNNVQLDSKISIIAETEIPNAKARLNHVIEMTADSAHRTMNAVDNALPLAEKTESRSHNMNKEWKRFRERDMSADEFRDFCTRLDDYFPEVEKSSREIHSYMTEVMMAQDFQDLTGQIITRVISLVQEVEESLVGLVKMSGQHMMGTANDSDVSSTEENEALSKEASAGCGPEVPGVDHGNTVNGQDEVDDLLSSLGF